MIYVLLSTYNGAQYLPQQLESILGQDCPNLHLLIRDDGSTDTTVSILHEYEAKYPQIKLIVGKNIGVVASFFALILAVPTNADFVAFCDQDDIWLSQKLSRAISCLNSLSITSPNLYCSATQLINAAGDYITTVQKKIKKLDLSYSLIGNIVTGCTAVFNQPLLKLLQNNQPKASEVILHDWWIYLLASACGKVCYDEQSFILYRQHANNVVGNTSFFKRIKKFCGNLKKYSISRQAAEFYRVYQHHLTHQQNQILTEYINTLRNGNFFIRFSYILRCPFHRVGILENLFFHIIILFKLG